METDWFVARYQLRQLKAEHPHWSKTRLAQELVHLGVKPSVV